MKTFLVIFLLLTGTAQANVCWNKCSGGIWWRCCLGSICVPVGTCG